MLLEVQAPSVSQPYEGAHPAQRKKRRLLHTNPTAERSMYTINECHNIEIFAGTCCNKIGL